MLVHVLGGGGVLLQEDLHGLGMLVEEGGADDEAPGDQGAAHGFPFLRHVQGHPEPLHLGLGDGDEGLGEQGHAAVHGGELGHHLGGLALPLHGHVGSDVQAVLREQVGQGVFGGVALAGGVDGLALEIGHGLDGFAALLQDVQDPQGVHGQHGHAAVGLVVEDGAGVHGQGQHVQLALEELGRQLVGGGRHGGFIGVASEPGLAVAEELHHAHGGGALEAPKAHDDGLRRGLGGGFGGGGLGGLLLRFGGFCSFDFGLGGVGGRGGGLGGLLLAARKQGGQHQQGQEQGDIFLHRDDPSFCLFFRQDYYIHFMAENMLLRQQTYGVRVGSSMAARNRGRMWRIMGRAIRKAMTSDTG